MMNRLLSIVMLAGLFFSASAANAALYTFTQEGFAGGGSITGSFEGVDLNNDGFISGAIWNNMNEVTNFSVSWSGNSTIGAFSQTLSALEYFSFNPTKSVIGDINPEGIATNWFGTSGFQYLTGQGVNSYNGSYVVNAATGEWVETFGIVNVSLAAVPVPGAVWLFGSALVGFIGMKRRQTAVLV